MLIRDMEICRLMVYVQQVEEEMLIDKEEYMDKKAKTGISLGSRKVVRFGQNFGNKRGMHYHLLVHLRLETEVSVMARIHKISRLDQPNLKVVWHKEVDGLLHVVRVVETTPVSVVMAIRVASSAVKSVTL